MSPSKASSSSTDAPGAGAHWKYLLKRMLSEFGRDGGTDLAAKLTYFMVLSIAPTLLAVFSLATLLLAGVKDQIAQLITDAVKNSGMQIPQSTITSTLDSIMSKPGSGTVALIIGILTALWSASAYVKAFSRASNTIYDIPEGRGPVRLNAGMLGLTAALVVGILIVLVSFLLNQTIVDAVLGPIADVIGAKGLLDFLTDSFLPVWAWVKWPVVVVLLFVLVSLLLWGTPNIRRKYRLISAGGVFAVVGIAVAAVALSIYMSTVASYSSYGAIGGIMAVLFALWVINIVLLMGAELDAETERVRELAHGRPAEESLTLPLRDDAGAKKKDEKYEKVVDEGRDIRLSNLHRDADAYRGADRSADDGDSGDEGSTDEKD